MGTEGKAGKFSNLLGGALGEFRMRIQSRAHRSSADGEVVQSLQNLLQTLDIALEQTGPAAEFLSKGQGYGILHAGAPDLDHIAEFLCLGRDRVMNGLDSWNRRALHSVRSRDVHRRWERVVRRLRHVYVVIGMKRPLRAQLAARDLDGAVGDDLVHVHVSLRAAAG